MRAALMCCMLALSSSCAATSHSSAKNPASHTGESQQAPKDEQRGTEKLPVFVNIKSIPPPTPEEKAEKAEERQEKVESDRWLVKLTGALVIATLALVGATVYLWLATRRLVKGAEDTARRQLRAYVSVESKDVIDAEGKPVGGVFGLELRNNGQTPAHKLVHWTQVHIREFPLHNNLEQPEIDQLKVFSVLDPHRTRMVIADFPSDEVNQVRSDIESGKLAIYVWGEVGYNDVFGLGQTTKFVFWMGKEGLRFNRFALYATGNEST